MEIVALVTLSILIQFLVFTLMCGAARAKSGVEAPAVAGDPVFERAFRVQQNTLEQLMLVLPSLWVCAYFFSANVAAIFGAVFLVGRFIYRAGYMGDPKKRGPGMLIGLFATLVLIGCGLWGVVAKLI